MNCAIIIKKYILYCIQYNLYTRSNRKIYNRIIVASLRSIYLRNIAYIKRERVVVRKII